MKNENETKIIKVNFTYENELQKTFTFSEVCTIREICEKFALKNGINFNSVFFLCEGIKLENLDFNKSLRQFINKFNKDTLNILVFSNSFKNSYIYDDNDVHAIFTFKSDFIKIQ